MFDKFQRKSKGTQAWEYDGLLRAMNNLAEGNKVYLSTGQLPEELVHAWNKLLDSLCNNRGKCLQHLSKVNESVEALTNMDFAKELIEDIRYQKRSLESMAASGEEMAASIDEVANRAQSVARNTQQALEVASQGEASIKKAFSFVEDSFAEFAGINQQMDGVVDKTKQITDIVAMVKSIADQTNLLALNAAIEAARAGEHGRGFAVVAEEVRNLADNTKQSVSEIQQNIGHLENVVNQAVVKIRWIEKQLDQGKALVHNTLSDISGIGQVIAAVNNEVMEIAANTEEQTAVTQSFAEEINKVAETAEKLIDGADKTGKALYNTSIMCNTLKVTIISDQDKNLDTKMLLDVCKTDHLMWRWRVYNMLLGYDKINIDTIGTHMDCRLGKWYYSEGIKTFTENSLFTEMETPHQNLHRYAKEAVIAYEKGEIKTAEQLLLEMDKCSKVIVSIINKLKEQLK